MENKLLKIIKKNNEEFVVNMIAFEEMTAGRDKAEQRPKAIMAYFQKSRIKELEALINILETLNNIKETVEPWTIDDFINFLKDTKEQLKKNLVK